MTVKPAVRGSFGPPGSGIRTRLANAARRVSALNETRRCAGSGLGVVRSLSVSERVPMSVSVVLVVLLVDVLVVLLVLLVELVLVELDVLLVVALVLVEVETVVDEVDVDEGVVELVLVLEDDVEVVELELVVDVVDVDVVMIVVDVVVLDVLVEEVVGLVVVVVVVPGVSQASPMPSKSVSCWPGLSTAGQLSSPLRTPSSSRSMPTRVPDPGGTAV